RRCRVCNAKQTPAVGRKAQPVYTGRNRARDDRLPLQARHAERFDSNVTPLCKDMLVIRRNNYSSNWFEEFAHLAGIQVDGIKCAAAFELRPNSIAQEQDSPVVTCYSTRLGQSFDGA